MAIRPTVEVDPRDIRKLSLILNEIAAVTGKALPPLVRQAARFAVVSAAKATKPGTKAGKAKSLLREHRVRKFERIPPAFGYWYRYTGKNGKVQTFRSDSKLSIAKQKKKGKKDIRRLNKGVKLWSKKHNKWDYSPAENGEKIGAGDKRRRIPYAGAAKAGWRKALRKLGNIQGGTGADLGMAEKGAEITHTVVREMDISISNLVSYVSKTAPMSARIGIQKATNRVKGTYLAKYGDKLESRFRQFERS